MHSLDNQAPFSLAACMRGSAEWMIDLMDPENHHDVRLLLELHSQGGLRHPLDLAARESAGDDPGRPRG